MRQVSLLSGKALIVVLVFFYFNVLSAQKARLSSQKAIEDLDWLYALTKDIHIDLNSLLSQEELADNYIKISSEILQKKNLTTSEFYSLLLPFYHQIEDIHLSLQLKYKNNDYYKAGSRYFLSKIAVINDSLYIVNDYAKSLPQGVKIISFNKISSEEIIRKFRKSVASDGDNSFTKDRLIEKNFTIVFPLLFPVLNENTVQYFEPHSKDTLLQVVKGISRPPLSYLYPLEEKTPDYYQYRIYTNLNTAYLRIENFTSSESEFTEFLSFVFSNIRKKGIKNLILDIRDNEGGYTNQGEMLFSYLNPESSIFIHNIIYKNSKIASQIISKRSRNLNFIKRMYVLPDILRISDTDYGTYDTVYYNEIIPSDNYFSGKLYVLINGLTASTSGLLCNSLRNTSRAVFIGENGGFTNSGTFGQILRFRLPNSGIIGFISTIRFNSSSNVTVSKEPFKPDIMIIPEIDDITNSRDIVLSETLRFIRDKHTNYEREE